jgi:hypothetical protein
VLALAAVAAAMTFSVSAYIGPDQKRHHVFSGAIPRPVAGQYVEVLGHYCGAKGDRLITATRSVAGGRWKVENPHRAATIGDDHIGRTPHFAYTPVYSGTVFRARWNGSYSKPWNWQVLALPKVARVAGSRTWVAHVLPATPWGDVGYAGKPIELQRLTPGGWKLVRTAKLARRPSGRWGSYNFEARFTVPTRGLRLRAYLPDESAAPCFKAGGSLPWWS